MNHKICFSNSLTKEIWIHPNPPKLINFGLTDNINPMIRIFNFNDLHFYVISPLEYSKNDFQRKLHPESEDKRGLLHREDGPAGITINEICHWYLLGQKYEFNDWIKKVYLSDEEIVELKLRYT